MNWYYAEGNEQKGPVSETDLDQLFQNGQISESTLIWKEGMANWEAYSKVRGAGAAGAAAGLADGSVVCSQCGQMFGSDDVIRYGDSAVCAGCKPVFLQKLREGGSLSAGELDYAGFGIRFGAKFLDNVIMRVVGMAAGFAVGVGVGSSGGAEAEAAATLIAVGIGFALEIAYRTFFIGAYGATPGKMACKIRVVNEDGSKVTYGKAAGRAFAEYLSAFICLIGYIMAAFDDQKRTLHDRICGTRVIRN